MNKLLQPQQQPNATTTQPQHSSWVGHEKDCTNHPIPFHPPTHQQKLNCSLQEPRINIYWPQLNIMWPVTASRLTPTTFTTTTTIWEWAGAQPRWKSWTGANQLNQFFFWFYKIKILFKMANKSKPDHLKHYLVLIYRFGGPTFLSTLSTG